MAKARIPVSPLPLIAAGAGLALALGGCKPPETAAIQQDLLNPTTYGLPPVAPGRGEVFDSLRSVVAPAYTLGQPMVSGDLLSGAGGPGRDPREALRLPATGLGAAPAGEGAEPVRNQATQGVGEPTGAEAAPSGYGGTSPAGKPGESQAPAPSSDK